MHMIKVTIVKRTTRMIPCYTCLAQSFPAGPAYRQNTGLAHRSTAHHLYSIIKHQHTNIQAIMHNKQEQ
jgi:hypothetical protein